MLRLFRKSTREPLVPSIPDGRRVYAIGDVHGRLDLLDYLVDRIDADDATRPAADTQIVLLGDLIDRGPDSAGVVMRAMALADEGRLTVLKGNHEAAMLAALDGDRKMTATWLTHGGKAALMSWGVAEDAINGASIEEVIALARAAVPTDQRRWLTRAAHSLRIGDYLFVHAGIRPGVAIDQQDPDDMMWIRSDFLNCEQDHGCMIVHGHSITPDVQERPNRIGIDTGAYRTGRLTALGLQGRERWLIEA